MKKLINMSVAIILLIFFGIIGAVAEDGKIFTACRQMSPFYDGEKEYKIKFK